MRILLVLLLSMSLPTFAEVKEATPSTFLLAYEAETDVPVADAFGAIGRIGEWWNSAHTYSGISASLTMELRGGGCFCERYEGVSVEHARVLQVLKNKLIRLEGSLGPLQALATTGIWQFELKPAGTRTTLTMTYRVRGSEAGLDKLAPVVDRVMGEAFLRYVASLKR